MLCDQLTQAIRFLIVNWSAILSRLYEFDWSFGYVVGVLICFWLAVIEKCTKVASSQLLFRTQTNIP